MAGGAALRVALTGGIATGKTYVRRRLHALGVPTIDADAIVHELLSPGSRTAARVVERFGAAAVGPDGAIDRRALGALVFSDAAARRDLEALVHPEVLAVIDAWFATAAPRGSCGWAAADIPLLFETGHEESFDKVVVAACEPAEQLKRVMARDSLGEADARARLAAQWPIALKAARADFVVWTDGTCAATDRQVDELYRALTTLAAGSP